MGAMKMSCVCIALLLLALFHPTTAADGDLSRDDAFQTADADSDGLLTAEELVAAVSALGMRTPETNAERASLIAKMDANLDGKVDKAEFTTALSKGDSLLGKISIVATRFIDNVGLLSLVNQFAVTIGVSPGDQTLDTSVFAILSLAYSALVFFGCRVSYFIKHYSYCLAATATVYTWLLLFTVLDMNTEYPAGFTVLCFLCAVVGTADYIMEAASPKKNAAAGRKNAAVKAKAQMRRR